MNRTERNSLITANLPLVGYLVAELCAKATHLSRDDLASSGALALVTAADAFDPDLGVPFGAYARRRIVGAFADEMRSGDWASRGTRRRIKETVLTQETLRASLGRTATIDELADAMGIDREEAREAVADSTRTVSALDETTENFLTSREMLPEESALAGERLHYLRAAIAALPERMRMIVEEIYFNDRSVKEIADELGITHSAVSQQRTEAMRLLKDGLSIHYEAPNAEYTMEARSGKATRNAYIARLADYAMYGLGDSLFGSASQAEAS